MSSARVLLLYYAALAVLSCLYDVTKALEPQLPSHDVFFTAFDGTRFAFPVFHKGIITLLSHNDHLINAVFIDRGAGQPLMTGVAIRYKSHLRVFAATLASSRQTNVSLTILVNDKRMEMATNNKRYLLPVGQDCELVFDRRPTGDERLVVQTPAMTVYVLKYWDSPNVDMHIDIVEPLDTVHGVLGQTYHWVGAKPNVRRTLDGDETRYIASSIFADDAKCNLFAWSS